MLHAVIMAGGSGTRFWPESRRAVPKQLLPLSGERTMIQATVDRLGDLVSPNRILIATNQDLVEAMHLQLPELPSSSLLAEPCKRDTAPCIGLAALSIMKKDPDATMAVMPADHIISPDVAFRDAISFAARLVDEVPERLVTFGVRPSYASESFGYIERAESLPLQPHDASSPTFQVRAFHEKPKRDVAEKYLAAGNCYWNAGIFVWKAATIANELAAREPAMFARLEAIVNQIGDAAYEETLAREFAQIKGVSIDYAVMEHAKNVLVIEAPFAWDDVGSWQSLSRLHGRDDAGNTVVAKHLGIDTGDCIIRGQKDHLIVTMGTQNLLIVQTPDATLVADKSREESIRALVDELEQRGWSEYL